MRTGVGCILIKPYQSPDGSWYADAWYGELEAKKDCTLRRLPRGQPAGERAQAIEGMKTAALLVLRQQGIEKKNIHVHVTLRGRAKAIHESPALAQRGYSALATTLYRPARHSVLARDCHVAGDRRAPPGADEWRAKQKGLA